ncbi:uncharacterized protein METZ01_LOCUS388001, partial [marine metagenome]
PTGSVTISGTAAEDQVLTASNDLADEDVLGAITYTWSNGDTGSTTTLGQSDVGSAITVTAAYTDGQGTAETSTSAATAAVANVEDAPTISSTAVTSATEDVVYSYTVVGDDEDGDTLTMVGTTVPSWLTFDASTGVLTGTPGDADIGDSDVVITVSDASVSVTDTFTIAVANVNDAPAGSTICTAQSTPTLTVIVTGSSASGTFTIGSDQTAEIVVTTDNWPGEGSMTVGGQTYTWGSAGTTVSLTDAGSYTLQLDDSYSDGGHTATVTLSDCETTYVLITGDAYDGETLTA